jgi:hypothetical protein
MPTNSTALDHIYAGYLQSYRVDTATNISGNNTLYLIPNDDKSLRIVTIDNRVTSIAGNTPKWIKLSKLQNLSTKVSTVTSKRAGIVYNVEISFTIPRVNPDVTQLLTNMLDYNVSAIVSDNNGYHTLYGLSQQLTVTLLDMTNGDANQYEVRLTAVQKREPIGVASAGVAGLPIAASITPGDIVPGGGGTTPGTGGGTTPITPGATNDRFPYTFPFKLI